MRPGPKACKPSEYVGIVQVPRQAMCALEEFGLGTEPSIGEIQLLRSRVDYATLIERVFQALSLYHQTDHQLHAGGVFRNSPGLTTTTFDRRSECYIGLHLDSWDKLPLTKRAEASNRLCINKGRGDRFLMFLNLSIRQILDLVTTSSQETSVGKYGDPDVGNALMKRFPSYPVVRVRIRPGEAYIAPTENIIHDGSTEGNKHADVQLTLRGYFGIQGWAS